MDLKDGYASSFASAKGGKTVHINGFRSSVSSDMLKDFLETRTGVGSVYALKIRPPKTARSRAYAIAQFVTSTNASVITTLAQLGRLIFEGCLLKVQVMERDIVPNPKSSMFAMEHVTLLLGCPVSKESFSVLWKCTDVEVRFAFGMRKLHFLLSYQKLSYKLDLSYESIWEIQLRHSVLQKSQFLLIQVVAAPRIFEKVQIVAPSLFEDPMFNFFKDLPDDLWVRTTDFTPNSSIGQSSALCLQLPFDFELPKIQENFYHYKETEGFLNLQHIDSYSHSLELVPIVEPHLPINVPYNILFKINHMVQNGTLMGPTLDDEFFCMVSPQFFPLNYIERALEKMSFLKSSCFDPSIWLRKQYEKFNSSCSLNSPYNSADDGLVKVYRVQVTPCKVYFYGPELIVSNRVIRHFIKYIDNFIRISFVDEDGDKMYSTDLLPRAGSRTENHTSIYKRMLSILKNGITIGTKKFDFLAFSSSQLRDNSAWMFAPEDGVSAASIRNWMGDFHKIRNVAKYAARLGQSFSSSKETLTVQEHEVEIILDIETSSGYVFSDGIGKISANFAKKVASKYGLSYTPSAFQIRYGGYKGVVAVDPRSSFKLSLRKSMSKFESDNRKLDVLAFSKFQPCFLNRQIITLLSTLGVRDDVFEKKQEEVVEKLDKVLVDPEMAREALGLMFPGETTNVLKELLACGYKPNAEPFLSMLLQTFRASKLYEIRTKSRIFLPKGRAMLGCLDETRALDYGQVFVQVSNIRNTLFFDTGLSTAFGGGSDAHNVVLKGKVIVAKNPCLHPGDVRVLQAVDIPNLRHMVDCVVFPQKGKRPHPNECSGSDLDGDVYFVSWDPELIPCSQAEPMEYTAAPPNNLDHDITVEEVEEYFVNYIVNDSLGIIANAHTVFADQSPLKAESQECIELAKLFSTAVDFPKTGVPAEIPRHLYVREYPDFMEKLDKVTYESKGVIGKMFRAIKHHAPQLPHVRAFTKDVAKQSYDPDMEVDGFEDYLEEASLLKEEYDFRLGNLMDHYGIKTEAEILGGYIMKMARTYTKNKDGETISLAVKSLRKEARAWFNEKTKSLNDDDDVYAMASAWYYVTYNPEYWGIYNEGLNRPHFLSFAWCVYDKLICIKQEKMAAKKFNRDVSVILQMMNEGLSMRS